MAYHYLEDFATADIAFEATGADLESLFAAAADATMNVMVENIGAIEARETRTIELENREVDMLLFDFLQELIYRKERGATAAPRKGHHGERGKRNIHAEGRRPRRAARPKAA